MSIIITVFVNIAEAYDSGTASECIKHNLFSISRKEDIPIIIFLEQISKVCNLKLQVDTNAQDSVEAPSKIKVFKNERLSDLLDLLLKPNKLAYKFDNDTLVVFTNEDAIDSIFQQPSKKITYKVPKAYSALGKELAPLQQSCKIYQKLPLIDQKMKSECKKYDEKVTKAFEIGYKIDNDSFRKNEEKTKAKKYLTMMRDANKDRKVLEMEIESQIIKAREHNNVDKYIQLIQGRHYRLTKKDYQFMDKHHKKMKADRRYIRYAKLKKEKEREIVNQKERRRREIARKIEAEKLYKKAHAKLNNYNPTVYLKLLKKACNLGHPKACYDFGLFNHPTDPYNKYYQKSCKLNYAQACSQIATSFLFKRNFEKGLIYEKKACALKDSDSCLFISGIYKDGFHVKKSDEKFLMYQNKAEKIMVSKCNQGGGSECKKLGDLYYNPEGSTKYHKFNAKYAIQAYRTGCKLNNKSSCKSLADLYYDGKYGQVNAKEILRLYDKACMPYSDIEAGACWRAGKISYTLGDYKKASKYFEQTSYLIRVRDSDWGFMLGDMYATGKGVKKNIDKAKEYFKKSCETGKSVQKFIREDMLYGCRAYNKLLNAYPD